MTSYGIQGTAALCLSPLLPNTHLHGSHAGEHGLPVGLAISPPAIQDRRSPLVRSHGLPRPALGALCLPTLIRATQKIHTYILSSGPKQEMGGGP